MGNKHPLKFSVYSNNNQIMAQNITFNGELKKRQ